MRTGLLLIALFASLWATGPAKAEGRQLDASEVRNRIVGKLIRRTGPIPARGGGFVKGAVYWVPRPDGSFLYKCEWYNERAYAWQKCGGLKAGRMIKGFTNGVWRMSGANFCIIGSTAARAGESCYSVREHPRGLIFRYVSGSRPRQTQSGDALTTVSDIRRLECIGHFKAANC